MLLPQLQLGDATAESGRLSAKRFCVIDLDSHEQARTVAKQLHGKTFTDNFGNLRKVYVGWWYGSR